MNFQHLTTIIRVFEHDGSFNEVRVFADATVEWWVGWDDNILLVMSYHHDTLGPV